MDSNGEFIKSYIINNISIPSYFIDSSDPREGRVRLRGWIACLLMPWLLNSPEQHQWWHCLYRMDNMHFCSIAKDSERPDSDRWVPLRGDGILTTPRVWDSPILYQPRWVFRINPTTDSSINKNYTMIIQFMLSLTKFYRSGSQRRYINCSSMKQICCALS